MKGFPVPNRPDRSNGLEIPLSIMVVLVQAERISFYNEKFCIKGFSAILVPMKRLDDLIVWHLLLNSDGSRISYSDNRISNLPGLYPEDLTMSHISTARHVLGWCPQVDDYTGMSSTIPIEDCPANKK